MAEFSSCCCSPGALWILTSVIRGTISHHDASVIFDTSVETSVRTGIALSKIVFPLLSTYIPFKASEHAHMRYRQLDPNTPPRGFAEKVYDVLAGR